MLVIAFGSLKPGNICADTSKLKEQVESLNSAIEKLKKERSLALTRLHSTIDGLSSAAHAANPSNALLMVGAAASIKKGEAFDFPVTLTNVSTSPVVLQGDFTIPTGFTLVSITAGPSTIAAGKTLVANLAIGRFLIYGFNETTIPAGIVVVARFQTNGSLLTGIVPICITGPVAADKTTGMPIATVSGFVKVVP